MNEAFLLENEDGPQKIYQRALNDMVKVLALSKDKAEILAFRLKEWFLLKNDGYIHLLREIMICLLFFFCGQTTLCFC